MNFVGIVSSEQMLDEILRQTHLTGLFTAKVNLVYEYIYKNKELLRRGSMYRLGDVTGGVRGSLRGFCHIWVISTGNRNTRAIKRVRFLTPPFMLLKGIEKMASISPRQKQVFNSDKLAQFRPDDRRYNQFLSALTSQSQNPRF